MGWLSLVLLAACTAPAVPRSLPEQDKRQPQDAKSFPAETLSALRTQFALLKDPEPTRGLGGLAPQRTLSQVDSESCAEGDEALEVTSGWPLGRRICRSYLVEQDGKTRLVKKKSELKVLFAPIESREEALSYALATTPSLSLAQDGGQTSVSAEGDGFRLVFYHAKCAGVSELLYQVSRTGSITALQTRQISSDGRAPICDS